MEEVAISESNAKCLAILERVRETRNPILIARFGKPVAEAPPPPAVESRDWLGCMADSIEIVGDVATLANY